jgi:predicted dehydrogenase
VEKPCSHNVFEGRKLVETARKHDCIVQHGTQSRSSAGAARAVAAVASGKYGRLMVAKAYCCKPRWSIGFKPVTTPPAELDFDIWLGPAPLQPYHENLVHYNWHWFWDTGNGDMGNQGVHEMDVSRWGIGKTLPKSVVTLGGRWVETPDHRDQGQTPNMELSVFDFDGPLLVFETRGLVGGKKKGAASFPPKVAVEFYLEAGNILGGKFYPKGQEKGEKLVDVPYHVSSGGHFGNFINCVRSRKRDELNAEILEGHRSAALCHLGNISYRLGREVPFGEKPVGFPEHPLVEQSIGAIKDNLVGALGLDLSKARYRLGPKLAFDPETEKFLDNPAADKLLTREYRKPYVVPDEV